MEKSNHKRGLTRSEIVLAIAFLTIVIIASYPVFILLVSKIGANPDVEQVTLDSAQSQLSEIYELSRSGTFSSTLEALKNTYTVTSDGNITTLTKKDSVTDTTIKMSRDNPSSGIVITRIVVSLVYNVNQESPSHIETILIFR